MFGALKEALAPEVPLITDFKHHWSLFIEFYGSKGTQNSLEKKSVPIEQTYLTHHLNAILKILSKEREIEGDANIGPCMEYLIQNQCLDILSTLCQSDVPPGIRPYIFKLFNFLLGRIKTPIAYVEVFRPIRRLLMFCASEKASPTEDLEIEFISGLLRRLRSSPELLSLFAHASKPGIGSHSSSRRSSSCSNCTDWRKSLDFMEENLIENMNLESQHLVLSALLNYVDSPDYLIASQSMEGILTVLSLPDSEAARSVLNSNVQDIENTSSDISSTTMIPLSSIIIGRLVDLFEEINHSNIKVSDLSELKVNWVEAHHHSYRTASNHPYFLRRTEDHRNEFPGKSHIISFFAWFDYVDNLVRRAHPLIGEYLCYSFNKHFLENCLEIHFGDCLPEEDSHTGNDAAMVIFLAHLNRCWSHIDSQGLAKTFSTWLIGDSEAELNGMVSHPLKHLLIEMCLSSNVEVALETLHLFDTLLERPSECILSCLVLGNLSERGYYHHELAVSQINSWSEEEDEREKSRSSPHNIGKSRFERHKAPTSRTLAPSNIHRIINMWLFLVCEKLQLKSSENAGGSYESYLKASTDQFVEIRSRCSNFDWPLEANFNYDSEKPSSESKPEGDPTRCFYEGEFLFALFSLLQNILNTDQELNLQTTSTLSKLCLLPHPFLHEYLLNPTIPLNSNCRTLYSTLSSVCDEAASRLEQVNELSNKMKLCRKAMTARADSKKQLLGGIPEVEVTLINGIIVLEEFCKEIAAITFAKYSQSC
ncbi:FHF complex subunit HOOK interacting protein 2A [Lepeophtheirus salmonis]|uniref:FHF complex subunit HOOK interacting protein 2A n=1 Tax=Lepeophtheirus salmonis TaxID=72036 RepID=UPI001AE838AF|nr:protein FAM160B1-like [Lepeophtheirus salmonis]